MQSVLQCVAVCFSVCCSVVQCVLQCGAVCVAVWCSACCSVVQCVLQCVAVRSSHPCAEQRMDGLTLTQAIPHDLPNAAKLKVTRVVTGLSFLQRAALPARKEAGGGAAEAQSVEEEEKKEDLSLSHLRDVFVDSQWAEEGGQGGTCHGQDRVRKTSRLNAQRMYARGHTAASFHRSAALQPPRSLCGGGAHSGAVLRLFRSVSLSLALFLGIP